MKEKNFIKKYFHQLSLLLWKNFLIKKRSLFVFMFELTVPLVLFLIMFAIRLKQHAKPVDTVYFDAWPLPSAGFIPLMQSFCKPENGVRNEFGFMEYPNSTSKEMMEKLENILQTYDLSNVSNFLNSDNSQNDLNKTSTNDTKKESNLEKLITDLSQLSVHFPTGLCKSKNPDQIREEGDRIKNNRKPDNLINENIISNNDEKFKKKLMKNYGFVGLWFSMQKTFCGASPEIPTIMTTTSQTTTTKTAESQLFNFFETNKTKENDPKDTSEQFDSLNLSKQQLKTLSLLFHVMYSNPVILYTPNTTLVTENLIRKSNTTFELIDKINNFCTKWLDASPNIVNYLTNNNTNNNYLVEKVDMIDSAACSWLSLMSGVNLNVFKGFDNEEDLVNYFLNNAYFDNVTVIASLVFDIKNRDSNKLDSHIKYKIRQNASFTYTTKKIRERYWYPSPRDWDYYYYLFGFVWLQDLIDRAIIDYHSNSTIFEPGSYLNQMPYPCYMIDNFLQMTQHVMPLCLSISFVYTVAILTQTIVYEKEMRLKEVMKIMGLNNSVHILAWFITYFIQFTLIMSIVTCILHFGKILTHSNPFLIFFLLEIYAITTICFSFLVSSLYSKAKLAAACAGILYFLSYVPCMYISIREDVAYEIIPWWAKTIACLLSTSAFGIGSKYIAFYENDGVGLQWHNMNKSPLENDTYNCLNSVIIMVLDCFLYLVLAWYIENVNPSYGIPLPWNYPFKLSYWNGKQKFVLDDRKKEKKKFFDIFKKLFNIQNLSFTEPDQAKLLKESNLNRKNSRYQNLCESEPSNLKIGVSIKNLVKQYNDSKLAVDNLSINFYENQITSFLGHNGAGKTTTMSILTGLIPATSGYALIYDKDIRTDINLIRKNLGFCPQHNILFDKLTVEEHLWFYAKLKLMNDGSIKDLIENMLNDTGLLKKRHNLVHTLSGGMQRKLSVGIAFVGDANLVILDEPTAGVDPHARRAIWDMLLKYKQGRTIILSTHHMDEAELLGDRIAIISDGKLQCCGTSLFLKNALGEGNNLTLVKDFDLFEKDLKLYQTEFRLNKDSSHLIKSISLFLSSEQGEIEYEQISFLLRKKYVHDLLEFIQKFIPSVCLKEETLREYNFVLPLHERSKPNYWNLFKELEKNLFSLKIKSFGIHDVSLEEIFIKAVKLEIAESEEKKNVFTYEELSDENLNNKVDESSLSNDETNCELYSNASLSSNESLYNLDYIYEDLEAGWSLYIKQVFAIVVKRYLYNKRNWKSLLTQIILPACFICIAMTVALSAPGFLDLPSLELSTSQFYSLTKPEGIYIPYSYNPNSNRNSHAHSNSANTTDIIQTLKYLAGIGSACVLNKKNLTFLDLINSNYSKTGLFLNQSLFGFTDSCQIVFNQNSDFDLDYFSIYNLTQFNKNLFSNDKKKLKSYYPECNCMKDNSGFSCSGSFDFPSEFKPITHETLLNISGENETNYYLYTTDMYRLKRYGGLSFDNEKLDDNLKNIKKSLTAENDLFKKLEKKRKARIWYNNKGFHSMPVFLNVMNNALLRANVKNRLIKEMSQSDANFRINEFGITVINHPMNQTNNYLSTEYLLQGSDVLISIFTIVAMSFVNASFVLFLVYERSIKSLHLQFLMGLNPFLYWITNFIWDMINYMLPASCVIIIFKIFDVPAYVQGSNYPAVILLFLFYGWSVSPLMYPLTFIFKEPSSAYIFLIVINLFTGITCVESSFLLQVFSFEQDLKFIYELMKTVFLIFPPYCLGRGLIDIAYNDYYNSFYTKTGQISKIKSPFEWEITTRNLVAMTCIGFISWIFTLLLEYEFFKFKWLKLNFKLFKNKYSIINNFNAKKEDLDVKNERLRIENCFDDSNDQFIKNDQLILKNLRKIYLKNNNLIYRIKNFILKLKKTNEIKAKNEFVAVKNLSFGVPKGECFGLLGVNGAGKTTTFKMLTTDLSPTDGNIYLKQNESFIDALLNKKLYWQKIGYCPQFDALYDELTPSDHIRLFARLKGVRSKYEDILVDRLLKRLDLVKYINKPVSSLSLGNKRKLSTALALVGNPSIILLDEPTSGQDPVSRRRLWEEIINLTRIKNRSVLLTSHSMEECEALCTRLAIMVDGRFKCIGSVQHLKTKFGDGYTLTVKLKDITKNQAHGSNDIYIEEDNDLLSNNRYISLILEELRDKINSKCKLKERNFNNVYQFELPSPNMNENKFNIGDIYRLIELNKLRFNIADYSLSQNTLDNVFINFIKEHTSKKLKNQNIDEEFNNLSESDEEEAENARSSRKKSQQFQFPIHDTDDLLIDVVDNSLINFETDDLITDKIVFKNKNKTLENHDVSILETI
nr:ATP-binding cassette transporter Abca2 [Brachionus angularis]